VAVRSSGKSFFRRAELNIGRKKSLRLRRFYIFVSANKTNPVPEKPNQDPNTEDNQKPRSRSEKTKRSKVPKNPIPIPKNRTRSKHRRKVQKPIPKNQTIRIAIRKTDISYPTTEKNVVVQIQSSERTTCLGKTWNS
jgi:hypothetical protein